MDNILEESRKIFVGEAKELIAELEESLLELENEPSDQDRVAKVFRAMHTLKGSGAMFGFDDIAAFTHNIENVYDLIRSEKLNLNKDIIDYSLKSIDIIKEMLDETFNQQESCFAEITKFFNSIVSDTESGKSDIQNFDTENNEEKTSNEKTFRIRFKPDRNIFFTGTKPERLIDELREMGDADITLIVDEIPEFVDIDPHLCYVYWDIVLTTQSDKNGIRDVFIFVEDSCDIKIEEIDTDDDFELRDYKRIGEILVERGDIDKEKIDEIIKSKPKLGEMLVETKFIGKDKVESALAEQEHMRRLKEKKGQIKDVSYVRVPLEKLDILVNLVGELVTFQARITQIANMKEDPDMIKVAEEIEGLTTELRDSTMNIRMLQIGSIFGKFKRLVRDLSMSMGKEINLVTEGGETELDKTVIDQLNDPLVHMIRNCVDHGIETPEERKSKGKPVEGTVKIVAEHSGAHVLIHVEDDGKGMSAEKIKSKAIEKGLVKSGIEMSEREIFDLIFLPGFSTAEKITDVSGRGVGTDVLKKSIESLRGTIEVTSHVDQGTKFTLKLPLTLAIIDGLLVKISKNYFVLPLLSVEECVELENSDDKSISNDKKNIIVIRGEAVPYIRLNSMFSLNQKREKIEQVVVVNVDGKRTGFVVDSVIGEHQTVIKSLGDLYKGIDFISGATILGDGTVAMILDLNTIVYKQVLLES